MTTKTPTPTEKGHQMREAIARIVNGSAVWCPKRGAAVNAFEGDMPEDEYWEFFATADAIIALLAKGGAKTCGIRDDVLIAMMRASATLTPDAVKLSMNQAARVLSALPFGPGDVGKAIGLIEQAKRQAAALIAGDDMNPATITPDPETIVEWLDQSLKLLHSPAPPPPPSPPDFIIAPTPIKGWEAE